MWKIKNISEADFGCEERQPGEELKCLVTLVNENDEKKYIEIEDRWLTENNLDEGDPWPEEESTYENTVNSQVTNSIGNSYTNSSRPVHHGRYNEPLEDKDVYGIADKVKEHFRQKL